MMSLLRGMSGQGVDAKVVETITYLTDYHRDLACYTR